MSHHHEDETPRWVREILEGIHSLEHSRNEVIRLLERILHQHKSPRLAFKIPFQTVQVQGVDMTFTMLPTQQVSAVVSPVLADGTTPSQATLSAQSYISSDPSVVTAVQDTVDPSAVIITGLGAAGTVVVTATATATEPDGTTTEVITGAVTVILAGTGPGTGVAAALIFTFGTPGTPVVPVPVPVPTPTGRRI